MHLAAAMDVQEPPLESQGLEPAAGAVVVEPDGRAWIVAPTGAYLGTKATFPKGKAKGLDLKATALKEVFEESGLRVELFQHLVDVTRTTSRTRYYLARRVGSDPADMGWESQAAILAPMEDLRNLLNRKTDHHVVDALEERWGEWGWWFKPQFEQDPTFEPARGGELPARQSHWIHFPLPKARVRIELDFRLGRAEAENLKLGFIPRMMEQKWFAYYYDGILYEHRSWTGFCISEIHFVHDGEGLRATWAEVNRHLRQYENKDDAEDIRLNTERIRELAHMTWEDRHAEDPFVAGLKASMEPNYLGNPKVVDGLLEPWFNVLVQSWALRWKGQDPKQVDEEASRLNRFLAEVVAGERPDYPSIGDWHSSSQLGQAVLRDFNMDPDYFADEALSYVLEEALGTVALKVRAFAKACEKDPDHPFKRGFLPSVQRLAEFTRAVLMGTATVLFPAKSLKDITYGPTPGADHGDLPE